MRPERVNASNSPAELNLRYVGHEVVRNAVRVFADAARRVRAHWVEVPVVCRQIPWCTVSNDHGTDHDTEITYPKWLPQRIS